MSKPIVAVVAAVGGIVLGFAGARAFTLPSAPANAPCAVAVDPAAEAKADAIARQLHAHDHDAYVPHPAPPIGELPKPAKTDSSDEGH
ncbi:MAG: hypothetical protein J0I77_22190 [Rudaea sp.]|uniref:hypothetical protein n=1 Tax=unclassified Rudaea TaxID=2627037 RepID=UPI0010F7DF7E|nr:MULTISPECIES: hypothetical protein [unclassified Rudaea]MBN8888439.1 hypothetical protein [Rudaea sp.]MBR0347526.1 hypothetical protein [Rudaea sp.]